VNTVPAVPGAGFAAAPRPGFRSRVLTFIAMAMLVPLTTGWLSWHYEKAGFPVKPRDFTLAMGALLMLGIARNRPTFCWPALLPIAFLLARVLDAMILERYSVVSLGTHDFYVMIMLASFLVTLLFILIPSTEGGMETARWLATAIILGCAAANLYEWLDFASFTRIPGRMSGYLEDPNQSPILICLLLGVLFTVNPNFWWNMAVVGVATVAIAVTLSRSGMAVFAAMVLPYVAIHFRERARGLVIIAILAVPLAGVGLTLLAQSSRTGVIANDDVGSRLQAIYDLDFEKIKSPERAKDLEDGWEAVSRAVLFGHGTGAGTNQWQPHNQFVSIWLDIGIFGVLFFATIVFAPVLASVKQRFRGFFCLIPVLLFIPCSQILIEAPVYWFTLSVACHVLFPHRVVLRLLAPAHRNPASAPSSSLPLASH
jgi:hypothetical protein